MKKYSRVSEDHSKILGAAEIPDCRPQNQAREDYRNFPEEKVWSPRKELSGWISLYVFMARSALTFVQEQHGVSNREAMENSCTGSAEQHINDVLHRSEYLPEVALKNLLAEDPPKKIVRGWSMIDRGLFIEGIARHGKNFQMIRKDLLPHKDTKELIDYYYAWKWSKSAMKIRESRRRYRSRSRSRFPSIGLIFGRLGSKIVTRSASAASRASSCENLAVLSFPAKTRRTKNR